MAFRGMVITYDGQSLLTQTQISKQFTIKCVRIGDGKYSADHHDIHSMVNPLYDVVPEIQHKDNQLLIEADITSNDHSGYYLREIGIIATDASGQEVLYAYDNADNDAEYINPVDSGIAYEKRLRFALSITDDITINIHINGSVYALQRDLVQHVNDQTNPHNVTVEQLGLYNVDNTADKDKPISDAVKKALGGKEPVFSKNSAFNKAFGNTAGTVCQGNDSRLSDARKNPEALTFTGGVTGSYDGSVAKSVYIPTSLPSSDVYDWAKQPNKPIYTKSEVGLSNVDNTSDKDKSISDATKKALDGKEPVFSKNSAFNKNFGNAAGTVCQGNDSRLSDARTPKPHNHNDLYHTKSESNQAINGVSSRVTRLETNGVSVADTLPVGAEFYYEGDPNLLPDNVEIIEPPFSNDNGIINGDFRVWQRGESFADVSDKYTADRWYVQHRTTTTPIVEKVILPNRPTPQLLYAMHIHETTANNTLLIYKFEDVMYGENTYSFYISGTAGTNFKTAVNNEGNVVATVNVTSSWSRIVFQASDVSKLYISIGFPIGDFYITGVKTEYGEINTPFVPRPYTEELMLCQRYYQVYPYNAIKSIPFINDSIYLHFSFKLVPEMRVPPTLLNDSKFYADGLYRMTDGGYDRISEIRISKLSKSNEFSFTVIGASKLVVGMQYVINNNSVIKGFDAEIY